MKESAFLLYQLLHMSPLCQFVAQWPRVPIGWQSWCITRHTLCLVSAGLAINWIQHETRCSSPTSHFLLARSQTALILQFVLFSCQERRRSSPISFYLRDENHRWWAGGGSSSTSIWSSHKGCKDAIFMILLVCVHVNDVFQAGIMKYVWCM